MENDQISLFDAVVKPNPRQRIEELVHALNAASEAYYGRGNETMTDGEWNAGFDELTALEEETGYILPDSPTQNVSGSQDEPEGAKEAHEFPALSLAKTKKVEDLQAWAGERPIWLSWKLDGLTVVLTYDNGVLVKILTRGNGSVGTNITYMKDGMQGFPTEIPYMGHMVVRGEATISYPDFERVNLALEETGETYKNPRNLASGTLGLDAKHLDVVRERNLTFNAFTLVYIEDNIRSWGKRMDYLRNLGFTVVDYEATDAAGLPGVIQRWTERVEQGQMLIPVDGLVIAYDDTDYAATGSVTGHHATNAGLAFKWQDTEALTVLDHVEWSCAASLISPVAVFEPVELEGTTVSRASLCNISEMERLGIGEDGKTELKIIKANKIIPKCIGVTKREGHFAVPSACPVCGAETAVYESESGVKTLKCTNPDCAAKNLMKFSRFVGKSGLDIDGLSIETLRVLISRGYLKTFADLWSLGQYSEEIAALDGFGKRSCEKLLEAVEVSRKALPEKFLTALCIPMIGTDMAKKLVHSLGWQGFLERLEGGEGFEDLDGLGSERSKSIQNWYASESNRAILAELLAVLDIEDSGPQEMKRGSCFGLTFVITGDVHHFKNRDDFKAYVESQGGKVAGSVSGKTAFLVNNDLNSTSGKNKKARELEIPILSEDDFIARFGC